VNPDALSEEVLSAYVDGECTDEERVAVEARLASDAEWREILEEVRATRALVRALPRRRPPVGFVEALVDAPEQSDADVAGVAAHRGRWPRVVAGLAAAAALAVGFLIASPSGRGDDVAPPIAVLANSHGAAQSLQSDPLSGLAPIAATSGIQP
jgi:anti-sigma factor RsiW